MACCPKCGAEIRQQARFCSKCGSKMDSDFSERTSSASGWVGPEEAETDADSTVEPELPSVMPPEEIKAATSSSLGDLPLIVGKEEVVEQASVIARKLLELVPFAKAEHRDKNKTLFEKNALQPAPIEDSSWGRMAHIAGVYGQVMWEIPLTIEPKLGLWQALVWAIQYEYYFRPKLFAGRFLMLAEFLSGCAEDTVFRTHAFENIEILLREFDATNLQKVRDDLIKLPTSPTIVAKETGGEEDPLGFLNEDQRAKLLESMRSLRLDQMRTVLRRARGPLLAAISKALSDTSFDEILPPRRTFYVRSNNRDDSLVEVKKRLMSPDKDTQNKALLQLEQIARETTDKENGPIAREWLLFARARVQSLNKAVPLWREDYNKGIASWEEIWNLAVALVRSEDFIQALEVLKSGVKELNAPFSHLRFALKSNVDILQHAEIYNKATISLAVKFLLDNLTKLPLAECYLTWLLLANEVQEPIDYNKQLYIISIFQDILDRPIRILRPENQAEEVTIEDFENDFEGLLSIMQRLEDNYILEPHKERIGIKSKMLTTFLRTPQIVPKRVGLFVDYENLRPMLPVEMQTQPKEVGDILARHASKYGDVVCRWLCAAPRNIPDSADMSEGFQRAGFVVQFPRGRTGQLFPTENLTDFVLVECITFEMMHSKPDIYVIVSGDGDYFEKIMRLLEQGNSVHLISSANNMASRYRRLEQRSQQYQLPEDYGGFFIDNLNEILQTKLVSQ